MKAGTLLLLWIVILTCTTRGEQRDPVSHETITRHARPRIAGEVFDPQESDPRLRAIFAEADLEAEYAVRNTPRNKQFIFRFWQRKKAILRKKHRLDWKTPGELNPTITYGSYGQPSLTAGEIREISSMIGRALRNKEERIVSVERTFDGTINVWTTHGETRDRGTYVVARVAGGWKIVAREVP